MQLQINDFLSWLTNLHQQIQLQKEYLTDLDRAIGDSDHGVNLSRGFQEVIKRIEATTYDEINVLLKDVGMTLLGKVGGASGPLYGTIFLKASNSLNRKECISEIELVAALNDALEGLKIRGKANVGDKTMIDVWEPIVEYMKKNIDTLDWKEVSRNVELLKESTREMEAKKGRAAYLGARSIGHIDPGAASSAIFFSELAKVCDGVKNI